MDKETQGVVIAASRQWWLKINTKPIRIHGMDGAVFPYIIKVRYTVEGTEYVKRKWIRAGHPVPAVGSTMTVLYACENPKKAKII